MNNSRKAFSLLTLEDELLCQDLVCCWEKNKAVWWESVTHPLNNLMFILTITDNLYLRLNE